MPKLDANTRAHLEWLGFVRPTGLVVSPPALNKAGAVLERADREGQRLLRDAVSEREFKPGEGRQPWLPAFEDFARSVLGWRFSPEGYAGGSAAPIPDELSLHLPDCGETLRPDFAVRERSPNEDGSRWQLLVQTVEPGLSFDRAVSGAGKLEASPHSRMERLLRAKAVPAGLLFNGRALRLVSAPRGETSGWTDFQLADMLLVAGRPICTALRLLLNEQRLLALPRRQRLAALLADSRKYQNEVSERLAEQVLHALYELLRGFQAAHDASRKELLGDQLREDPGGIYHGLLTVVLRLVFLLYAEERDLLSEEATFVRHYSLASLHDRLRADAALHPDTMDQRYGAWAQLLALFRMIHNGAAAADLRLPPRHGVLFDFDRFPFLEGRPPGSVAQNHERVAAPLVSDGTVHRALEKLLVLDGDRLSYRALDVEQIGSVYETMMGFRLERAEGPSCAIKPAKRHGAPATVNLAALLEKPVDRRVRWFRERTDRRLTDKAAKALRNARTIDELHAGLDRVIDRAATPDLAPKGHMILQPSDERRRSGSHYTPRELTEPIVRDTLEPILDRLREQAAGSAGQEPATPPDLSAPAEHGSRVRSPRHQGPATAPDLSARGPSGPHPAPTTKAPRPEQILGLKVCDPAMGSGAFLVESCRQLGDALVDSWHAHDAAPPIPPDEDEAVHARRLVARNCLYGVDRNAVAVDLAKLSLWLTTLARDHPLTFLDHALRHGDSLVGLAPEQIQAFHWKGKEKRFQAGIETTWIREQVEKALRLRRAIQEARDDTPDWVLRDRLDQAEDELARVKRNGDLVVAAFFERQKPGEREALRRSFAAELQFETASGSGGKPSSRPGEDEQASVPASVSGHSGSSGSIRASPSNAISTIGWLEEFRNGDPPLAPFHWAIEYPEVFLLEERENSGFDAVVGNPPFAGKNTIGNANVPGYKAWLKQLHEESHGNADLVAHFFRRAFTLVREGGAFGLIATNTIAQGDTRSTGLRFICKHGGEIFRARRRVKWPGLAAVVVSVVHLHRGPWHGPRMLDGVTQPKITAFLFHRGGHEDPARLTENAGKSFQGSIVLGMGFTFDDTDTKGVATPLAEMNRLIEQDPKNREAIFPYIGGKEVNASPIHAHHRYVINFHDWPLRREDRGDRSQRWATAPKEQRKQWLREGGVPVDYPDPVAADWPELLAIVEERVKPERAEKNDAVARRLWWQFLRPRPELQGAIAGLDRVLAISRVTQHVGFAYLPAGKVYADRLIIFPSPTHAAFCALQSRPHELWARFFGSSLEDRLTYTPSDCFETFPFPENWETHSDLEVAGAAYHGFRADLMLRSDEGLTKTYYRFHDPEEQSSGITRLRELHSAMDRAVLAAYGWTDIGTACEFLLDYEIDEETWGKRKKPYRYRWPDEVRDEVLARLLELNAQRAAEEKRSGSRR